MTTLTLPFFAIMLLIQVGVLGTAVLFTHRLSTRFGLIPLLIVLGALVTALEFNWLGYIHIQTNTLEISLPQASFLLLPVILLGILIIYIFNGTQPARTALVTLLLLWLGLALLRTMPDFKASLGNGQILTNGSLSQPFGVVASAFRLGAAMVVMIIIYQALSNLRNRYPSRAAASLGLLAAVWLDAILFSLLTSSSAPILANLILILFGGNTLAVVTLWPLFSIYLGHFAVYFPETGARTPRLALDLFSNTTELEARARYQISLLRTISQISQLIGKTSDPQILLERACQYLVSNRAYSLVWIGMVHPARDGSQLEIHPAARAGRGRHIIEDIHTSRKGVSERSNPAETAAQSGQAFLIQDIAQTTQDAPWQEAALQYGFLSSAALPMRHAGHTLGVLNIFGEGPNAFDREETDLLQELADELAHALISLEARQQQAILHTAVETMQDGLFITNMEGRILYANPAIAQLLEVSSQELEGLDIRRVFPTNGQFLPFDKLRLAIERDEKADIDLELRLSDQRNVYFSIRASLAMDTISQPAYVVINLRDTTRHHQYEHQLLTLNRFTTELVQAHEVNILMDRLFVAGESLLQADASSFFLLQGDNHSIAQSFTHNLPALKLENLTSLNELLPDTIPYPTRQPIVIAEPQDKPGYAARLENLTGGMQTLLLLPISLQDRQIGALSFFYRQVRRFTEEEIQLGLTLAHTLAISLENTRLYQAEKSQREFAEALARGAAALNNSLEFDRVLDQILDQTLDVVQCRSVNIMLIEGDQVRVVRHLDKSDPSEAKRPVTGKALSLLLPTLQQMLSSGKPLVIPNTSQDPLWQQLEQTTWIRSYAAAPLQVQGRVIGFLNMNSDEVGYFTAQIFPRLQAFADTSAAAIQNASLYKESQMRGEELATLVEAAAVVSSSLDVNQVLQVVAEQMISLLNVRGCAISDYDPEIKSVKLISDFGPIEWLNNKERDKPYYLDEYPLTRQVLVTGEPLLVRVDDPDLEANERRFMERNHIKVSLMLPLVTRDRTIGLVELIDDRLDHSFSESEIELVQTLASHAAIAIENARLYQHTQKYAEELEDRVRERTMELRNAKERIEHILVSVPDAIIVLDEDNRLIQANPSGDALIVQANEQGLDIFNSDFLRSLARQNTPTEKTILQLRDRAYQALASSLPIDEKKFGTVIVFRDVTRFREIDQMKTQFVSDVSHELRTPLTNLSLYLDLLATTNDTAKNQRFLATLRRETQRLTSLIEDLLTISRLEADRVEINIEPVNLNHIVSDLAEDRRQMAANLGLNLTYTTHPELPYALADARLLTQVLSNLLTNALNYTPPSGHIHLQTLMQDWNDETWITVEVTDNGLGIPPEELEHLFTRFFRGFASQESSAPGTGLGLAISKEIIDRLNGRITVKSQPNQGSTFTVWLQPIQSHSGLSD